MEIKLSDKVSIYRRKGNTLELDIGPRRMLPFTATLQL